MKKKKKKKKSRSSLVAQTVKNLRAVRGAQVRSLSWEDRPVHYSFLENPMEREVLWATQSVGTQRVRQD